MKNGDLPMKNGDLPMKNGDVPKKNGDFHGIWWWIYADFMRFYIY